MKPEVTSLLNEPELDIRRLCRSLWSGKYWIIGLALLCAGIASGTTYLLKPQWQATAVIDKPAVSSLSGYYTQQQFLSNFDSSLSISLLGESFSVTGRAYHEFIVQLAGWDTRRDFWLVNDYYKRRQKNEASDKRLLRTLINNIQFIPRDDKKILYDNLELTAETAIDAYTLLQQYIEFVRQRSVDNLNAEVQVVWNQCAQRLNEQIKWQETAEWDVWHREIKGIQQALKAAKDGGCLPAKASAEKISCFDVTALQSQLNKLQAMGPAFDIDYSQNKAMLASFAAGPVRDDSFQTYRYLRTPDKPVDSESSRYILLLIIGGCIGAVTGVSVALIRGSQR